MLQNDCKNVNEINVSGIVLNIFEARNGPQHLPKSKSRKCQVLAGLEPNFHVILDLSLGSVFGTQNGPCRIRLGAARIRAESIRTGPRLRAPKIPCADH